MSFATRRIASAALALAVAATSGQAIAGSLGQINAIASGTTASQSSRVSKPTGAAYVRGQRTVIGAGLDRDFPAMVKLKMVYEHDGFAEVEHCGGTVIDSRYIVTAAHCIHSKDGSQWDRIEVVAGDYSLESTKIITRAAHQAIRHAGADNYLSNDIAIVKLDQPLPREIVPATIDDFRRPTVQPGGIAVAAGWPVTGAKAGQTTLQKVPLSVTDVEWPGFITVTSPTGQIEGVCQGESGGPLMTPFRGEGDAMLTTRADRGDGAGRGTKNKKRGTVSPGGA